MRREDWRGDKDRLYGRLLVLLVIVIAVAAVAVAFYFPHPSAALTDFQKALLSGSPWQILLALACLPLLLLGYVLQWSLELAFFDLVFHVFIAPGAIVVNRLPPLKKGKTDHGIPALLISLSFWGLVIYIVMKILA